MNLAEQLEQDEKFEEAYVEYKKQLANKLVFPYNITHHNVVHIKMNFFHAGV